MYARPIWPSTLTNEKLVWEAAVRRQEDRQSDQDQRADNRVAEDPDPSIAASAAAAERERHRHADQEHERRLDHVPENAPAPRHVVELLDQDLEDSELPLVIAGIRRGCRRWRYLPDAIASITKPR